MDPNQNLQDQEKLIALLRARQGARRKDAEERAARAEVRDELSALRAALHTWLSTGGFEPRWSESPNAAKHFRYYGGSNAPELIKRM